MAAISNDWLEPLQGEFKKPYYKNYMIPYFTNIRPARYFLRRMIFSMHFLLHHWQM